MYMRYLTDIFGLLSDSSRLRILMLLDKKELCVCQIMGVLGMAQPLVSRNLSLLFRAGLLDDRREGKMVFYSMKRQLPDPLESLMAILRRELFENKTHLDDILSLGECEEFQKKTGKCGMEAYLEYMKQKKRNSRK